MTMSPSRARRLRTARGFADDVARGEGVRDPGRAEALRISRETLLEIRSLDMEDQFAAVADLIVGVRDGALEQAALVCERNEERASASEIRSRKSR